AETRKYAIVMNAQNLPEVKWGQSYSSAPKKDRERQFTHTNNFKIRRNTTISFDNTDNVVAQKGGTVVFGAATYLPPYGKVSGFDTDRLKERGNAVDWISTTRPGLVGYSYENVTCHNNYFDPSRGCPEVVYKTQFTFGQQGLQRKAGNKLDIYEDKSRDNSPIYKLSDYPWLGVSFNLSSESLVKEKRRNKKIFYFNEDVTQQNSGNPQYKDQNLVYTTGDGNKYSSRYVGQNEHSAIAFYLNAKLHLLDKTQIKDITQGKTVDLGTLKPRIELSKGWKNRLDRFFLGNWTLEDKGKVSVNLGLPQVKAGRCINKPNPNPKSALSPALTAPALWFEPGQDGKAEMYSASVSTYPDSSSSRIYLQNLKRKTEHGKPGRYSLKSLNDDEIKSRQPSFNGRQTIIRLDSGVQLIKLNGSKDEVVTFGNTGNNGTFGIVKEANVNLEADEWKKVLLPWTVRGPDNDNKFKSINQKPEKYSQRYRIRDNNGNRDLGDIVNSPIVAVGGYLATAANDGMVHIFKKNGGSDERSYNLKLSYIPGTMPRKDIESNDSTLAKELRAFAEKGYVGDRYGVDGGFVLRRITDDQDRQKHFFMFGAMGLGGRGAYALDLSKINGNYPAAAPLFDVKDGDNNGKNRVEVKLGYTVGTPQIGKTQNGTYSAFLASGYAAKKIDDSTNKTALYVYDLKDTLGTPIAKIEAPGGKGGLSSPTLVDKDLDGTVDIAYAGDRGGNMYRFDLSNSDSSKWSAKVIFEGDKPITSAPAVSRLADKRVVIFG
ncbi:TPA: PilC family type IV pilus tip adhesin, partial [Neisseria gonorrhoeae]